MVFRCGASRRKSSGGSAASKRFFGRPSSGADRTGGGRSDDTRFLDIDTSPQFHSALRQRLALESLWLAGSRVSGGGRLRKAWRGRHFTTPHALGRYLLEHVVAFGT